MGLPRVLVIFLFLIHQTFALPQNQQNENRKAFVPCSAFSESDPEIAMRLNTIGVQMEDFAEPCKSDGEDGDPKKRLEWYMEPRLWYEQATSLSLSLLYSHLFQGKALLKKGDLFLDPPSVPRASLFLNEGHGQTKGMIFRGGKVYINQCRHVKGHQMPVLCIPSETQLSPGLNLTLLAKVESTIAFTDNHNYALEVTCVNGKFRMYSLTSTTPMFSPEDMRVVMEKVKDLGFNMTWFRLTNKSSCETHAFSHD